MEAYEVIMKIKVVALAENVSKNSTPNRLRLSLQGSRIDFKILARINHVESQDVIQIKETFITKIKHKIDYLLKKEDKKRKYNISKGMPFTSENTGIDVSKYHEIQDADIIQLHWLGGYCLSSREIHKLVKTKKKIVVVCHDNGHFTGGCHVRMGCEKYKTGCGNCPQLHSNIEKDWSYKTIRAKKKSYEDGSITVVSPSSWMDKNVSESLVFKGFDHRIIPNSVNTDIFKKLDRVNLRKKYDISENDKVILFGAVSAVSVPYKGYDYLIKSLELLQNTGEKVQLKLLVFGSDKGELNCVNDIPIKYLGKLDEEHMAEAYNLADVYVVPSLEDSFNNTVVESMACETPVVAFATGGITDIILHKETGYLAEYKNSKDLAFGIEWILNNDNYYDICASAKERVYTNYTREVVSKQYIELYNEIID